MKFLASLLILTLSVNGLDSPNETQVNACIQKCHRDLETHNNQALARECDSKCIIDEQNRHPPSGTPSEVKPIEPIPPASGNDPSSSTPVKNPKESPKSNPNSTPNSANPGNSNGSIVTSSPLVVVFVSSLALVKYLL